MSSQHLNKKFLLHATLLTCLMGIDPSPGRGATANTTMNIRLTVPPDCTISATPMDFGRHNYADFAAGITANATITVGCSSGTYYLIGLDNGLHPSSSGLRYLKSGTNTIQYELYQDSSLTTIWGYGIGKVATISDISTGSAKTYTVFGKIVPISVLPTADPPGTYTDIVTVTLDY